MPLKKPYLKSELLESLLVCVAFLLCIGRSPHGWSLLTKYTFTTPHLRLLVQVVICHNPLTPWYDQQLISPHNTTPKLHITHHQLKKALDCFINSPCQQVMKCRKSSRGNVHNDVRVKRVDKFVRLFYDCMSKQVFYLFLIQS